MHALTICFIHVLLASIAWAGVPTGCVKIYNLKNGFLTTGGNYDNDRRHVSTGGAVSSWEISREEGRYLIKNRDRDEYLYAAGNHFSYDSDRRRVFTWIPKGAVTQGYWYITEVRSDTFKIKNTSHGEYLYAADFPSTGSVFTWGRAGNYGGDQFEWRFIRC